MSLETINTYEIPENIREALTDVPDEGSTRLPYFDVVINVPSEENSNNQIENATIEGYDETDLVLPIDEQEEDIITEEPVEESTGSSFSNGRTNNNGVAFSDRHAIIDDDELYDIVFSGGSNVPASYSLDQISEAVPVDEAEIIDQSSQREARELAAEATGDNTLNQSTESDEEITNRIIQESLNSERQVDQFRQRFSGASWYELVQQQEVILAGLGGIGSFVSLFLSRLNPKLITMYDPDIFETHNMSGQLVQNYNIGRTKIAVAADICVQYSNYYGIVGINEFYGSDSAVSNVMICGFDNMVARNVFFKNWKTANLGKADSLFIDGRLSLENFQIFSITGDNFVAIEDYEKNHLFSDSEVLEQQCSLKQTSHMAGMIGSLITGNFVNYCNNLNPDNFERPLPFLIEYNGIINKFDTHDKF